MEPEPYNMSSPGDVMRWFREMKSYLNVGPSFCENSTDRKGREYAWQGFLDLEKILIPGGSEVMVHELHFVDGKIDMRISGMPAKLFMFYLIQLFEQNGGKNFLTSTIADNRTGKKYEITVRDCTGKESPAEKITRLEKELNDLRNPMGCKG